MLYNCLGYIDRMFGFFSGQAKIVAHICFALSLGIGCVKMALGSENMNKFLTGMLINVITYMVLMWFFPKLLVGGKWIATSFARGAFSGQKTVYSGEASFKNYMYMGAADRAGKSYLNPGDIEAIIGMKIMNMNTGLLSLNSVVGAAMATCGSLLNALFQSRETQWWEIGIIGDLTALYDFVRKLPDIFIVFIIVCVYLVCVVKGLGNYCGAVIEYTFVYAVGVLLIPLGLWDKTKDYSDKIFAAFAKTFMKLMMLTIALYLLCQGMMDIAKTLYQVMGSDTDLFQRAEVYAGVAFMLTFMLFVVNNASSVAAMLVDPNASPRLGAAAAMSAVHGGLGFAMNVGKKIVSGVAKAGMVLTGNAAAAKKLDEAEKDKEDEDKEKKEKDKKKKKKDKKGKDEGGGDESE